MLSASSAAGLPLPNVEVLVCGTVKDDRGKAAIAALESRNKNAMQVALEFSLDDFKYSISGTSYDIDDLDPLIETFDRKVVCAESTTLGFVEMLLCVRAAHDLAMPEFFLTYVEPGSYSNERSRGVLHRRDFSLSDSSRRFVAVPGAALLLTSARRGRALVLAGYEGDRFQRFMEQNPIRSDDCSIVYLVLSMEYFNYIYSGPMLLLVLSY